VTVIFFNFACNCVPNNKFQRFVIFDFFNKEIDTVWDSLYEFFKQNFDEISQSSPHLISYPNFKVLDPNRTAKIKAFFLNLDKQD